jgi:hypothetical protein
MSGGVRPAAARKEMVSLRLPGTPHAPNQVAVRRGMGATRKRSTRLNHRNMLGAAGRFGQDIQFIGWELLCMNNSSVHVRINRSKKAWSHNQVLQCICIPWHVHSR